MVELRRGFKTEANDLAREIREELGLRLLDPLDPWHLADHLAIEVIPLSELVDDADGAVRYLLDVDPASFSAVTVFYGTERLVVHNDGHSPGRRASNLSHELAHGLLLHPPAPALDAGGCRNWDPVLEGEAEYLAGAFPRHRGGSAADRSKRHVAGRRSRSLRRQPAYGAVPHQRDLRQAARAAGTPLTSFQLTRVAAFRRSTARSLPSR